MRKQKLDLKKTIVSLNGFQMNTILGGDGPDGNGGGGEGSTIPIPGDCDKNLEGSQNCTTNYHGSGGTDNLCGSCPYHRQG